MKFEFIDSCDERIPISEMMEELQECVRNRCKDSHGERIQFNLGGLLFEAFVPRITTQKQLNKFVDSLNHLRAFSVGKENHGKQQR